VLFACNCVGVGVFVAQLCMLCQDDFDVVIEGPLTQQEKAKVCAFCVRLRWRWCMSGTAVYALPGRL